MLSEAVKESTHPHLISPLQHILLALLHLIVDVEELKDAVLPNVVSMFLGLCPVER